MEDEKKIEGTVIVKANKKVKLGLTLSVVAVAFLFVDIFMYANMIGFILACFAFVLVAKAKKEGATNTKGIKITNILSITVGVIKMLTILLEFVFLFLHTK